MKLSSVLRTSLLGYILLVVSGCSLPSPAVQAGIEMQLSAPLEAAHNTIHGEVSNKAEWVELGSETPPHSIGVAIERSSCYGTCPEYTLAFSANGDGCYCARANVDSRGTFVGKLDPALMARVAESAKELGVLELSPAYFTFKTDAASVFTLLILDARTIFVRNFSNAGPAALWTFEQLIDSLWHRVTWKRIGDSSHCAECLEQVLGSRWANEISSSYLKDEEEQESYDSSSEKSGARLKGNPVHQGECQLEHGNR